MGRWFCHKEDGKRLVGGDDGGEPVRYLELQVRAAPDDPDVPKQSSLRPPRPQRGIGPSHPRGGRRKGRYPPLGSQGVNIVDVVLFGVLAVVVIVAIRAVIRYYFWWRKP